MTRADNTHHLAAATAKRSADARQRAEKALLELRISGRPVTVAALATAAEVSRSWLYTQPDLLSGLRELTGRRPPAPRSAATTERSLKVRLAASLSANEKLRARVQVLTEQNAAQQRQLEQVYAELRRLQTTTPRREGD
ncbi:DUF6262 family protein [Saccharothrix syringae]|uniref:Transposase n=1 Tax=Saccharothrix syringae TaxID=103733 RepID=A0A5Q0GYP7_SACSY|nr:DUF6262 family protein [Saccharothrix syringae]QFZ18512.1 transposase [Saccharothrix syringae]